MKRSIKRILPILLGLVIICSIFWYLFVYDIGFMQDVLLAGARFCERHSNQNFATWLYNQAYIHSGDNDAIIIELAERYKRADNYTQAEVVLTSAIAEGGSADLYIALSKTYVEQNKLMDAADMLDSITNPEIKAQLDAQRPAEPVPSLMPGYYTQYISIELEVEENSKLYVSMDEEFPSIESECKESIPLSGGTNTICAIAVDESGLVSETSYFVYTIGGVIEKVDIADPILDSLFRETLNIPAGTQLYTNDLWQIKSLTIPEGVTDYTDLKYLTYLETLVMDGFAPENLDMLSGLSLLKDLAILNTPLSASHLEIIGRLPNLENLVLQSCNISNISGLSNAANLITLDLSNNAINDLGGLSFMENLTTLVLHNNALTNLNALSSLEKLTNLDVSYNSLTSLLPLASCKSLSVLFATNNQLDKIPVFNDTSVLTILNLNSNNITSLENIEKYTSLSRVYLAHNTITDVSLLSGLNKLAVVDFSHNQIKTLPSWDKSCELIEINGSNNAITSLSPLRGLAKLNNVYMDYNKITNVNPLADCRMLVRVSVYGNDVKDVSKLKEMSVIVNYDPT